MTMAYIFTSATLSRGYSLQIRREVLAAAGPSGHVDCGSAADKRLPMVDACIRESQRLYPVAPFVVRHLATDLRLKDGEEVTNSHGKKKIILIASIH